MWKNVRKIRKREKQVELENWMVKNNCDICAISETGLNGKEYVELSQKFSWVGVNRDWEKGKSGGVGFIVRNGIEYEVVNSGCEDVCFIKAGLRNGVYEWLIGSIYLNCEGVRYQENVGKVACVIKTVRDAFSQNMKIILGGDMNGHIWELDKSENMNGKLIKEISKEVGLVIVNCVWPDMSNPTWSVGDKEYALDYVFMDEAGLKCVKEASIGSQEDVVISDHAAVFISIESSGNRGIKGKPKVKSKKRVLYEAQWEEYEGRIGEKEYVEFNEMLEAMREVGEELNDQKKEWNEDRRGWFNDTVSKHIDNRKIANREYRKTNKLYGKGSIRTVAAKLVYEDRKNEAQLEIAKALNYHNELVMKEINKGGDSKALFKHIKVLMNKGKGKEDDIISVINQLEVEVSDEEGVKEEIVRFWSELFNISGNASLGIVKQKVDTGMPDSGMEVLRLEIDNAIKSMKINKATDESGLIAEYLKALKGGNVEQLRVFISEILVGGIIPDEWKESRVNLIHKGGSKKELKNYRPIAIVNVVCKLCMIIIRNRINEWIEHTDMLGDVQGGFRRGRRTEDNLFMLERIIEMTRARGDRLYVAFIDMEKAYDRVNRKKLFEVMRGYGIEEKLIRVIEKVYDSNRIKFVKGSLVTDWCDSNSGVRQGCPLSPLLFNIYVRELGQVIDNSKHGFRYRTVNREGGGSTLFVDQGLCMQTTFVLWQIVKTSYN